MTPTAPPDDEVDQHLGTEVTLVDLLDRLLGTGVVIAGDLTISLSGVDLVHIKLQAVIMSIRGELEEENT